MKKIFSKLQINTMYTVIGKQLIGKATYQLDIKAPQIAKKHEPGHFVIVRVDEQGERIPLTITKSDLQIGTISLVFQIVGVTTDKLAHIPIGEDILDVLGPLGKPTDITGDGTILCAGGGVGIAPLFPIVKAFHERGNRIISVIAARSKDLLILEDEIASFSDKMVIMTDDGSYGKQGVITYGMEEVIQQEPITKSVVIGPAIMMKYASLLTKKYNIPTIASLNTIMVDGTGMCGSCRVSINGKTKFVCADGPEFDAHAVDFDEMITRLGSYKDLEANAYQKYLQTRGKEEL